MPRRLLTLCLLTACTERPLGEDSGASTGSDDPSAPTTQTTQPSTAGPTTAAPTTGPDNPTTATVTTANPTSFTTTPGDPTTGSDDITASAPDTQDPKFDFKGPDPHGNFPDGLWLDICPPDTGPGTGIKGETQFGPLFASTAWFGYDDVNGQLLAPRLVFLDETADIPLAIEELDQNFQLITGLGVDTELAQQWDQDDPFWPGADGMAVLRVISNGMVQNIVATVTITGHSGTWDSINPDDPPRLQGTVEANTDEFPFSGSFDAVLCQHIANHIIAE